MLRVPLEPKTGGVYGSILYTEKWAQNSLRFGVEQLSEIAGVASDAFFAAQPPGIRVSHMHKLVLRLLRRLLSGGL